MYSSLLKNIILPLGDLVNKSNYISQLKYWRGVDSLSEIELEKLQEQNLRSILNHARNKIPFYKKLNFKESNNVLNILSQFPIIDKYTIRNQSDDLISIDCKKNSLIPYSSSGSSGVQTTVYMNKQEQSIIRGILTHWWEWSGYDIGKPIIQTGITPNRGFLKSLKDKLFRTIYINAFNHDEKQLEHVFKSIEKHPNTYFLAGYASSLNVISEYCLNKNAKLKVKGVVSLGDKLFDYYKKNIHNALHPDSIIDTYGSNEGFMIASQKDSNYYYILSPHVYVEIVDDENKLVEDGKMGNIVVTRLDCYSMPLIRYKIGDLGIKLPRELYPKDRTLNYPMLQKVVGRETDIIVLPDDSKMVVHSFTGIFEYIPEIKQFKVIQKDRGGIIIEFIKADMFEESVLKKATVELRKYITQEHFNIEFKEVKEILPTSSGKPQIIESHIL